MATTAKRQRATGAEVAARRLDDRLSRAMDRSSYATDLLDMAARFSYSACERWARGQWMAGKIPGVICAAERETIAGDAVHRFLEVVTQHEADEDGRPWIPKTLGDKRRLLWHCVRLALLQFLSERSAGGMTGKGKDQGHRECETDSDSVEDGGETPEERKEREAKEFQAVAEIVRQFKSDTDKRTGLAVAYSENTSQAGEKLGIHRANAARRLKSIQGQFETPAQELCRLICEALETVRTDRPCLLAPIGIPMRSEVLFGNRVAVRDR